MIGPVPKSAKRWARTAHLHEVKHLGSHRKPNSGNIHAPRSDRDAENRPPFNPIHSAPIVGVTDSTSNRPSGPQDVAGDVFSPSAEGPSAFNVGQSSVSGSSAKKPRASHRKQLSGVGSDLLLGCVRGGGPAEDANSDGDGWEDTDADASDFDV